MPEVSTLNSTSGAKNFAYFFEAVWSELSVPLGQGRLTSQRVPLPCSTSYTLIQVLVGKSFILWSQTQVLPNQRGTPRGPLALHTVCCPLLLSKLKMILRPGTENTSTCPQGGRENCLSPLGVCLLSVRSRHEASAQVNGRQALGGGLPSSPHLHISPVRDEQGARLPPQPHHLCIQPCHPTLEPGQRQLIKSESWRVGVGEHATKVTNVHAAAPSRMRYRWGECTHVCANPVGELPCTHAADCMSMPTAWCACSRRHVCVRARMCTRSSAKHSEAPLCSGF